MKYICGICGYVYDEEKEGRAFSDLPDDWKCPLCRAPKSEFSPESKPAPEEARPASPKAGPISADPDSLPADDDLKQLSYGQMAALCTNLARACEKQYKPEEAGLFAEFAAYYTGLVPQMPDAGIGELARLLQEDIDLYPGTREVIDENGDRGAARALVWGEKVARMIASVIGQYQREGEQLLRNTEIWVCTACGFIYIGNEPPERCPVCKVPANRFEKCTGRETA